MGHVIQCFSATPEEDYTWIVAFHMPLFIAVSGYFFLSSVQKCSSTCDFINKKFRRIYLPSLSWGMFNVLLIGGGKVFSHKSLDWLYLLDSLFTGLWFLTILFLFSVMGCLIHQACKKMCWLAWIIIILAIYFIPAGFMVNEMKFLLPFFVMAIWLSKYDWQNIKWWQTFIAIIVFILSLQIYTFDYSIYRMGSNVFSMEYFQHTWVRFVSGVSGSIATIGFTKILFQLQLLKKWTVYIGSMTLPVYALHQKPLIINKFFEYSTGSIVLWILLSFFLIGFSVIIYKILSKNIYLSLYLFGENK